MFDIFPEKLKTENILWKIIFVTDCYTRWKRLLHSSMQNSRYFYTLLIWHWKFCLKYTSELNLQLLCRLYKSGLRKYPIFAHISKIMEGNLIIDRKRFISNKIIKVLNLIHIFAWVLINEKFHSTFTLIIPRYALNILIETSKSFERIRKFTFNIRISVICRNYQRCNLLLRNP